MDAKAEKQGENKNRLARNVLYTIGAGMLVQGTAAASAQAANVQAPPCIIVNAKYNVKDDVVNVSYDADDNLNRAIEMQPSGGSADAVVNSDVQQAADDYKAPAMENVSSFAQTKQAENQKPLDDNFAGQSVESAAVRDMMRSVEPARLIRSTADTPKFSQRIAYIMALYEQSKQNSPYAVFAKDFQAKADMHKGIINSSASAKNEKNYWVNDAISENESVELDKSRENVRGETNTDRSLQKAAPASQPMHTEQNTAQRAAIVAEDDEEPAASMRESYDAGQAETFAAPKANLSRYDLGGSSSSPLYRNSGYGGLEMSKKTAPGVQNRNPWAAIDAKRRAKEEQKLMRKNRSDIGLNNSVMMARGNDVASLDKMMMVDRMGSPAPLWTHEVLKRLGSQGLLAPEDSTRSFDSLTRREGAVLTARSFNLYKSKNMSRAGSDAEMAGHSRRQFAMHDIDTLMREFASEVEALGYNIIKEVTDTKVIYKNEYDWKFGGEIRYSFMKNGGSPKYKWSDNRVRARLYGEKAISPNWKVHGLLEADKSNIFDMDDRAAVRDTNDGHLELSRIYLEGNYNWWKMPITLELGKTYAYLAEGNVLDSDFDGIKITANPNPDTVYSAGYGQVNDSEDLYYFEGNLRNRNQDYLGGYYHWDNYGTPTSIWALGTNYYTGNYTLGGMYLSSNRADGSGAKDGYVLSARYGRNFAWIPHTYEFNLKYYNMAGNTYINHTMNGLASYMNGFEGWGASAYYTPMENFVVGLEYYDLKDKTTDERGKTAWASLTWSF